MIHKIFIVPCRKHSDSFPLTQFLLQLTTTIHHSLPQQKPETHAFKCLTEIFYHN